MKTIQMTLDDDLVRQVDTIVKSLHTTRSAFARKAFREELQRLHIGKLEQKHKKGYASNPVAKSEFGVWETEQAWGEE